MACQHRGQLSPPARTPRCFPPRVSASPRERPSHAANFPLPQAAEPSTGTLPLRSPGSALLVRAHPSAAQGRTLPCQRTELSPAWPPSSAARARVTAYVSDLRADQAMA